MVESMKKMYERMVNQELYQVDRDLQALAIRGRKLAQEYNRLDYDHFEQRQQVLKKIFGEVGESIYMEAPIYVDYGCHITIGDHFYANYGCTLLDVARITIGDHVLFGPHVSLVTPTHPIDAYIRSLGVELAKEIVIGNHVWLGANVTVNPGVKIGDGAVIGSGSVVTKDIPANVIAAGNPCRIIREITQEDAADWQMRYRQFMKNKSALEDLNELDQSSHNNDKN